MAFNPAEYVTFAGAVASSPAFHAEARTRAALGRAYYGLYLAVRAAIRSAEGKSTDAGMAKGKLPSVLFSAKRADGSKDDDLIAVGTLLDSLYSARWKADYALEPSGAWAQKLSNPAYAEFRAKETDAMIKRLPGINFKPVLGQI